MSSPAVALDVSTVPPRLGKATPLEPDLAGLVDEARSGDRDAQEQLLHTLAPKVRQVSRRVLGAQHPDVEDTVQEGLIAIMASLRGYRGQGKFTHYASKIMLRIAIRTRKRSKLNHRRLYLLQSDGGDESDQGGAARRAMEFERMELMRQMLCDLPASQAEALWLRIVLGYSMEEAAAIASVSVNTLKTRMRLAKSTLRRRMDRNVRARALFPRGKQ